MYTTYIVSGLSGSSSNESFFPFSDFKQAVEYYCEHYGSHDGKRTCGDFTLCFSDHPVIAGISIGDIISWAYAFGYEQG